MSKRVLILFTCLVVAAVAVGRADRVEEPPARTAFAMFPVKIGQWSGVPQAPFTARVLEVLGLDDYVTRAYYLPDRQAGAGLYIGYWKSQRQDDAIHSPLNCLPGAGFEPVAEGKLNIPDTRRPGAPDVIVRRVVIEKGSERQLVVYWYQSHGRVVASEYWSKFYLVADAVRLNRTDGAIVRIIVPIAGRGADAEQQAEHTAVSFAKELLPTLEPFLPS